jgi:hypothetical protein
MQYPSNWHKENVNNGYVNNSMLVDIVKFSSSSKNPSNEGLDIKVDNISDIQPITLAKYAKATMGRTSIIYR